MIEAKLIDINATEDFEFLANDNSVIIPANSIQQYSAIEGSQLEYYLVHKSIYSFILNAYIYIFGIHIYILCRCQSCSSCWYEF